MTWMVKGLFAIDILKCNFIVKKKVNQNTTLEFYQSTVIKIRYVFHLIQLGTGLAVGAPGASCRASDSDLCSVIAVDGSLSRVSLIFG